jgi:hypothetical protein
VAGSLDLARHLRLRERREPSGRALIASGFRVGTHGWFATGGLPE